MVTDLQRRKGLISCSYNPQKALITNHIIKLSKSIGIYTTKYNNVLFLGDFNLRLEDAPRKNIFSVYNLTSMINKPKS